MESRTTIVPVLLPNGKEIRVEATLLPGEEEVSFKALPAQEIFDAVEGIAQAVATALQEVKPRKASVELGLEVGPAEVGLDVHVDYGPGVVGPAEVGLDVPVE